MGQIIGSAAKPLRCNKSKLSSLGTPTAGQYILVSSDNSMQSDGQGNFDCYIVGTGSALATALPLQSLADETPTKGSLNSVTSNVAYELQKFDGQIDECFNITEPTNLFDGKSTSDLDTTNVNGNGVITFANNTITMTGSTGNCLYGFQIGVTAGKSYTITIKSETYLTGWRSGIYVGANYITYNSSCADATYSDGVYTINFTAESGTTYYLCIASSNSFANYVLSEMTCTDDEDVAVTTLKFLKLDNVPYTKAEVDALIPSISTTTPVADDLRDFISHTPTYSVQSLTYTTTYSDGVYNFKASTNSNSGAAFLITGLEAEKKYKVVISASGVFSSSTAVKIYVRVTSSSLGTQFLEPTISGGTYTFEFTKDNRDWYLYLPLNYKLGTTAGCSVTIDEVSVVGEPTEDYITLSSISNLDEDNFSLDLRTRCDFLKNIPTTYTGRDIMAFNTCICIGDSLTKGSINTTDSQGISGDNAPYDETIAYPAKLAKLTGMTVTNAGQGGQTFFEYYTAHSSDDWSGNQMAIIQLGVNDAANNHDWTTDAETGLQGIIDKLKSENNGIKIFVATILNSISYDEVGISVAAARIKLVNDGIRTYVTALADEDVILLDMAEYGNLNTTNAYSCGHLSQYGYYRLAQDYCNYISYYMATHKEEFRFIQFIGTNYTYTLDS